MVLGRFAGPVRARDPRPERRAVELAHLDPVLGVRVEHEEARRAAGEVDPVGLRLDRLRVLGPAGLGVGVVGAQVALELGLAVQAGEDDQGSLLVDHAHGAVVGMVLRQVDEGPGGRAAHQHALVELALRDGVRGERDPRNRDSLLRLQVRAADGV
jgi:hypothetical protein